MTTQKRKKTFDFTTIADRLKTVSLSNDSHPTGVVKSVYGIPTTSKNIPIIQLSQILSVMVCFSFIGWLCGKDSMEKTLVTATEDIKSLQGAKSRKYQGYYIRWKVE